MESKQIKPKKKFYKRWWFWIIIVVIIGAIGSGGTEEDANVAKDTSSTPKATDTNKPTETKKEEPKKEEPKKDDSIKAGMYKVGADIKAGEYVVVADSFGMAYMQISKDSSGQLDSIIANDNISNRSIVTVKDGQYFEVKGGKIYPIDKAPKVEAKENQMPDGMYKVGVDIQPGEYKVAADGGMAYVEVAKNSNHVLESIISNDNFEGEKYITVNAGQYLKLNNAYLKLK